MHSKSEKQIQIEELNKMTLEEQYDYYEQKNLTKKEIIKQIAKNKQKYYKHNQKIEKLQVNKNKTEIK